MNIVILSLVYFLFSVSIMFILIKLCFDKKIKNHLLVLFSHGVAPFVAAIIFYASIIFIPGKNDLFYASIITVAVLLPMVLFRKCIAVVKSLYLNFWQELVRQIKDIPKAIVIVCSFFLLLYSFQLMAYPIVDNDSVHYLNQSEAFYEYKNIDWQKEITTKISSNDYFSYDSAVRPGVPMLETLTRIFEIKSPYNYSSFQFFVLYYYVLLLILLIFIIEDISVKIGISTKKTLPVGIIFFVFSYGLTKVLIYSAKEAAIYFFALFSIYIASLLIKKSDEFREKFHLLTVLGILLGINTFINLHGIIIESIILLVLFILSEDTIIYRLKYLGYVFLLSIPFGGLEFIIYFGFIFLLPLQNIFHARNAVDVSLDSVNVIHQKLYQFSNITDVYLKGKLQIFANIGYFGIFFWLYLLTCFAFIKKILKDDILRFLFLFIFVYYIIVIDPFRLINHPLSIVLWGSPKYAMLLIFLSLIVTSIFFTRILENITNILHKKGKTYFIVCSIFLIFGIIFQKIIIVLGTKILLSTIPVFKEVSFYQGVVAALLYVGILFLVILMCLLITAEYYKNKKILQRGVIGGAFFLVVVPFFATNVGKIPLIDTLAYLNKSTQFKLENTIYEGDMFKIFFQAKNIIPKGTILAVDYRELYAYNDYFSLRPSSDDADARYLISANCDEENWQTLSSSNEVKLCERR